jgi:hypothetical protein
MLTPIWGTAAFYIPRLTRRQWSDDDRVGIDMNALRRTWQSPGDYRRGNVQDAEAVARFPVAFTAM